MKLESYDVAAALDNGDHTAAIAALARHFGAGELSNLPVIERKVNPSCIQIIPALSARREQHQTE